MRFVLLSPTRPLRFAPPLLHSVPFRLPNDDEKKLFAALSVFVGGWTLEAAEVVCSAELRELESLLEKSLIREMIGAGDETRFMMLETIREYALEKLTPERETVCNAHAAYYVDLAGRNDSETLQRLNDQSLMLAQLSAEHENFYAAFEWLLNSGQGAEVLKAGAALWRFWLITGRAPRGVALDETRAGSCPECVAAT